MATINLKNIENKIITKRSDHRRYLNRVVSEAKMRNSINFEKNLKWKEELERKEKEEEIK